jgi:hypothetical protein
MEDVGVLQDHLASLVTHSCQSRVLVIIVFNRVEFLLEGMNKIHQSGLYPKFCRLIYVVALLKHFPPISNMGKGLKE